MNNETATHLVAILQRLQDTLGDKITDLKDIIEDIDDVKKTIKENTPSPF